MFNPTSWFVFVGFPVDEAVAAIKTQRPDLDVEKIRFGSKVTEDFRMTRVRVFYNYNGKVIIEPIIG